MARIRYIYFDFFQGTRLRQPTEQRQLLRGKQICNIQDFVKFKNTQLPDDMPETLLFTSLYSRHQLLALSIKFLNCDMKKVISSDGRQRLIRLIVRCDTTRRLNSLH